MHSDSRVNASSELVPTGIRRRDFLKQSAGLAVVAGTLASSAELAVADGVKGPLAIDFAGPDSLVHPAPWESLNPGYWKIENGALRRRLKNVGDRARRTGFPFHAMSKGETLSTDYDPSLPSGIIYRRDQRLSGPFTVVADFTYRGDRDQPTDGDDPGWAMYREGHGLMGIAFGAKSLFESYHTIRHAIEAVWADDASLQFLAAGKPQNKRSKRSKRSAAPRSRPVTR